MVTSNTILEVQDLSVEYFSKDISHVAVNHVTFNLSAGEVLGIVGESGSGKSTLGNSIIGLIDKRFTRINEGKIFFNNIDLLHLKNEQLCSIRGKKISFIFQNPSTALNPVYSIGNQIVEAIQLHEDINYDTAKLRALDLLREVGIEQPELKFGLYPHEFSGGMKQRVIIAIAIANNPELIIADEPTTALDVITQHQILSLLSKLVVERGLSVLFITHDMGVVANFCDRVVVMRNGLVVEEGITEEIFTHPSETYTRHLLSSVPKIFDDQEWLLNEEKR